MKRLLVLCAFIVIFYANENNQYSYASKVKSLYLSSTDSKVVGRLLPTAKVVILKRENQRVLLRIEGYRQLDNISALYFVPNRRILNAGFSKHTGVEFRRVSIAMDKESKQEWELSSVELWSDDEWLSADVNALYKEADELYKASCSTCHALHSQKEFSANQWPSVIKSMKTRAGFDTNTEHLVSQYLQKNAKDMPKH